jgi:hypothetical protein
MQDSLMQDSNVDPNRMYPNVYVPRPQTECLVFPSTASRPAVAVDASFRELSAICRLWSSQMGKRKRAFLARIGRLCIELIGLPVQVPPHGSGEPSSAGAAQAINPG